MNRRRRQSGFTLIETLLAGFIATILGAGLWTLLRSTYDSQHQLLGQNTANASARAAVDELADNLRGATGVTAATANDVTFTDNNGDSIRYWVHNNKLRKTTNGQPAGGKTVSRDIQSISFVYWNNLSGSWVSSSAPSTPSYTNAVDFSVTATMNDCERQISGSVRLRQK